jgi:hypothetical protein
VKQKACRHCGRTLEVVRLLRCVVCHEHYCRSCEFRRHGKQFCSRVCANVFFFGDEDESGG